VRARGVRATEAGSCATLDGWVGSDEVLAWWSAQAPDVPGKTGTVPMLLARHRATHGAVTSVWSWRGAIDGVEISGDAVHVMRRDGQRHTHSPQPSGWRIDLERGLERRQLLLGGLATTVPAPHAAEQTEQPPALLALPASFSLGERHYRRSEVSWGAAGKPRAEIALSIGEEHELLVEVVVEPSIRAFVPAGAENPLDNEPAAINGDGIQLYVACGEEGGAWLLVPDAAGSSVVVHRIAGWATSLTARATWRPTARGYALDARIVLPSGCTTLALDVIVNEIGPGRARRRGQLVLSGTEREFVYLRGDRHDPQRLLRFHRTDV
jgi:hypothetical protein